MFSICAYFMETAPSSQIEALCFGPNVSGKREPLAEIVPFQALFVCQLKKRLLKALF